MHDADDRAMTIPQCFFSKTAEIKMAGKHRKVPKRIKNYPLIRQMDLQNNHTINELEYMHAVNTYFSVQSTRPK